MAFLEVEDLSVTYDTLRGPLSAVRAVSFTLDRAAALGLVGESGCGKSTMARALIRVLPRNGHITEGVIRFEGTDLISLPEEAMNAYRWRRIAIVPQAAMDCLDPVYRVGDQLAETLRLRGGLSSAEARKRATSLFSLVGLEERRLNHYPHEFSGGMKQRAVIALALALDPPLLIADEPVTALDVIVQRQILRTLRQLRDALHLSLILITHDLSVVAHLCEQVAVMYAGRIVEVAPTRTIFALPLHPYTMGLRSAFPSLRAQRRKLVPIEGYPPELLPPPVGCAFAPRCPFAIERCRFEDPPLVPFGDGQLAACHRAHEAAVLRTQAPEAFGRLEAQLVAAGTAGGLQ